MVRVFAAPAGCGPCRICVPDMRPGRGIAPRPAPLQPLALAGPPALAHGVPAVARDVAGRGGRAAREVDPPPPQTGRREPVAALPVGAPRGAAGADGDGGVAPLPRPPARPHGPAPGRVGARLRLRRPGPGNPRRLV